MNKQSQWMTVNSHRAIQFIEELHHIHQRQNKIQTNEIQYTRDFDLF